MTRKKSVYTIYKTDSLILINQLNTEIMKSGFRAVVLLIILITCKKSVNGQNHFGIGYKVYQSYFDFGPADRHSLNLYYSLRPSDSSRHSFKIGYDYDLWVNDGLKPSYREVDEVLPLLPENTSGYYHNSSSFRCTGLLQYDIHRTEDFSILGFYGLQWEQSTFSRIDLTTPPFIIKNSYNRLNTVNGITGFTFKWKTGKNHVFLSPSFTRIALPGKNRINTMYMHERYYRFQICAGIER